MIKLIYPFSLFLFLNLTCVYTVSAQVVTNAYGQYLTKDLLHLRDSGRLKQIIDPDEMESGLVKYEYRPSGILLTDSSMFVSQKIEMDNMQYFIINIPKQTKASPVMIFIHGGAWMGGSPERFAEECRYIASLGITTVRVSYPLIPQGGNYHIAVHSLHNVVSFLKNNEETFNVDMSRLAFCGDSAGAYLSAVMAFSTSGCVAWVGISGTYDLSIVPPQGNFPSEKNLMDFFGTIDRNELKLYSPLYQIPKKIPTTLLLHGTGDIIIDYNRTLELADVLRKKRGTVETVILPLYSHTYSIRGYSGYYEKNIITIGDFAVKYMKP